ncbi:MAG: UTP--glucose-1-phosphate uridylyltransferase, partial [Bartonella sp.]|nr:UTP--glucose-1-phosphate uridylyltransferase [Bartonella sp.]
QLDGRTFDCGSKIGFIEANVAFALSRTDMHQQLFTSLKNLLAKINVEK